MPVPYDLVPAAQVRRQLGRLRHQTGWTWTRIARLVGCPRDTIADCAAGRQQRVRREVADAVAARRRTQQHLRQRHRPRRITRATLDRLAHGGWAVDAACAHQPSYGNQTDTRLCDSCPVRDQCARLGAAELQDALAHGDTGDGRIYAGYHLTDLVYIARTLGADRAQAMLTPRI